MNGMILKLFALIPFCALLAADIPAQQDRQNKPGEESSYGSGFFDQLRSIFGRFRNSDLQNVFQEAQPIQCSELISHKGEWKQVAFFNKDRKLSDWCRTSLEEVKIDLTVFAFRGSCSEDSGSIQVATKFPTTAGVKAYREGKIGLNQVDIRANDPVHAVINPKTKAYTFELPYLFLKNEGSRKIYSFSAPNRNSVYDIDVSSRWECKAVSSKDITYCFLICRVSTVQKNMRSNKTGYPIFEENAFSILSDGTEAQISVKLTVGEETISDDKPEEMTPSSNAPRHPILKRN
jgi:hypothetical protein